MSFRITGLDPAPFRPLFGQSTDALRRQGILRQRADSCPGYPDRVSLTDAPVGRSVLLLNHEHLPAHTPFRSSHAIYIAEDDLPRFDAINTIPPVMEHRMISLRSFDAGGMMINATLAPGGTLTAAITRALADPAAATLHAHFAAPGCFAAAITRA